MKNALPSRAVQLVVALAIALVPVAAAAQAPPLPQAQAVLSTEAAQALDEAMAGSLRGDLDLVAQGYFFPALQGGTLCMIGFRVGKEGLMFGVDPFAAAAGGPEGESATMEVFGVVLRDGEEVTRVGAEFQLAKDGGDDTHSGTYSFGDTLPAGSYEVVWGVRGKVSGLTGSRRTSFEVPNFMGGGPQLTSILVAETYAGAPGMFTPNAVYDGVRVQTATFHDNITRAFSADTAEVSLSYVVVGAQMDMATQAFNLEMSYRILDDEGRSLVSMPPTTLNRTTVAQPIPIGQIDSLEPGGTYQFEIKVTDKASGGEVIERVPFSIIG